MNNRLQQFLTLENLTPARLADMLGIQRSGLSHILSGRNKPGYDFILKLCLKFPHLNANWFITGRGKPYLDSNIQTTTLQTNPESDTLSSDSSRNFGMEKNQSFDIYKKNQQINYQNNDILTNNSNFNPQQSPESQNLLQFAEDGLFPISDLSEENIQKDTYIADTEDNIAKNGASHPHENRINEKNKAFVHKKKSVKRVIIFYNDGSFDELFPAKDLL